MRLWKDKKIYTLVILLFILMMAVIQTIGAEEMKTVELEVGITPGEEYTHTKWFVIIPMKLTPQIAIWVEAADGSLVRSVYVTEKAAEGTWKGGKDISRPEALPVYFHHQAGEGSSEEHSDAVSGATPKNGNSEAHTWSRALKIEPGTYRILVEINSSFDYNEMYPKKKDNVNGQPSLIYSADFSVQDNGNVTPEELLLQPIGRGDPQGTDGGVVPGTEGLTTALHIVEKVSAEIK